ncbi:MAG: PAS domain-containing protein [Pseudomonadota bacterium]
MSDQRPLVQDQQDNLFRTLQANERTLSVLRLAAPSNLIALVVITFLAFVVGATAVAMLIAQRNFDRSTVQVEILSRLLANEVQQDLRTATPFYVDLAQIAADSLALADISPRTVEDSRRNMAEILRDTTAVAAAVIDGQGRLAFEVGQLSAQGYMPSLAELLGRNDEAVQPSFAVFHNPVAAPDGVGAIIPISVALNDQRLGAAYQNARGYLVVLVPEIAFATTLQAFLPELNSYAAFLMDRDGNVLVSTQLTGSALLPQAGQAFRNDDLQGALSSFLDQDVSVFAAQIATGADQQFGSEWVGAFAAVPGQQTSVLVLDATDPVSLVLGEGAIMVIMAIVPAVFVILLFSYIVTTTWLRQDDRVRNLQSWVARYRVATNLLRSGLIEWFPNEGDVNLAGSWKGLLGYRNTEIGNDIDQLHGRIHPDDRARAINQLQGLMDGKMLRSDQRYRLENRDGGYTAITERAAVEKWPSGEVRRVIIVHSIED